MQKTVKLANTIDRFIQGDLSLLRDTNSPPWTEPGIISQVSKPYFEQVVSKKICDVVCCGAHVIVTSTGPQSISLAYEEFGAFFVRDLTKREHAELASVLECQNLDLPNESQT